MAQPKTSVRVVVELTFTEVAILARAAVVVTSALNGKDVNAAERGLRAFRAAARLALPSCSKQVVVEHAKTAVRQPRKAS